MTIFIFFIKKYIHSVEDSLYNESMSSGLGENDYEENILGTFDFGGFSVNGDNQC